MRASIQNNRGFGLVEMTVAIVIIGILAAVALQSMSALITDSRRIATEREMEMLAEAATGNPRLVANGSRSDFGYVGDVGAFPPNLQALRQNPGGYGTWHGPYVSENFTENTDGFLLDEWGSPYGYAGLTISSTGGSSTITRKLVDAPSDYLLNAYTGTIKDASDSLPGSFYRDSVDIKITIPDGAGSTVMKTYRPDSAGQFTFDSLPVGQHPLEFIYIPNADTLHRYLTILPRHRSSKMYKFASAYFSGAGCGTGSSQILRPSGAGSLTNLVTDGCSSNFECADEISADEDATRLVRASNSFATDTYALDDPTPEPCSIIGVTVYCRARESQSMGTMKPTLYIGGAEYNGSEQTLTGSYANYSQQWNINPNTGAVWTWAEVTALEAGVALKGQNAIFPAYCTQVWVEVSY